MKLNSSLPTSPQTTSLEPNEAGLHKSNSTGNIVQANDEISDLSSTKNKENVMSETSSGHYTRRYMLGAFSPSRNAVSSVSSVSSDYDVPDERSQINLDDEEIIKFEANSEIFEADPEVFDSNSEGNVGDEELPTERLPVNSSEIERAVSRQKKSG